MRIGDRIGFLARGFAMSVVVVILLVPVLLALLLSFDARDYLGPLPPHGFSLHWYRSFLESSIYLRALQASVRISALTVLVSTSAGVMTAVFLHNRRFPGREILLTFFLSPFVIPHIVIGFGLLMAFSSYGIESAYWRLVGAHTLIVMPFAIRTTLVGLQGLRPSYAEAAATLGARPASVFWEVTFPLVRPGIVASAVLAASFSVSEVSASVFLTDNGTRTLPVALLSQMVTSFDLTIAAASGLLVLSTVTLVVLLDSLVGLKRITGGGAYSRW